MGCCSPPHIDHLFDPVVGKHRVIPGFAFQDCNPASRRVLCSFIAVVLRMKWHCTLRHAARAYPAFIRTALRSTSESTRGSVLNGRIGKTCPSATGIAPQPSRGIPASPPAVDG